MRIWSLFFLLVPIFGVAAFAVAPYVGWDLPENVSSFGPQIDFLYYMILAITGITFVGTQLVLVWILFRYGGSRPKERALYTHGSANLEIVWTLIPAVVLALIAVAQLPTWIELRYPTSKPSGGPLARIYGRQFEWRIVYPGPDETFDTVDDIHTVNDLHIPMNQKVLVEIRSMDVLHSFFLPHARLKHDLVPGTAFPVWFDVNKSTREYQADHADFRHPNDFVDMGGLVLRLRKAMPGIDEWLFNAVSEETRALIKAYDQTYQPMAPLRDALLADLNRILDEEKLFEARLDRTGKLPIPLIETVELSQDTRDHLDSKYGQIVPRLLNRQILEDAYPGLLQPLDRHYEIVCAELCGWGHYKMKGRLVVHETPEEFAAWLDQAYAEQELSEQESTDDE